MRFPSPLKRGVLVQRYKRFLADIVLDSGETVTATCPNTGAMLGVCAPGIPVWVSESDNPNRKYRHTWEMAETSESGRTGLVGVNTNLANAIVGEALQDGRLPELAGYESRRREVRYGENSRIDFLLSDSVRGTAHVEVKNVHLMRKPGLAEFPDCVTERGRKHLDELAALAAAGQRAVMLFLIQRSGVKAFALAQDLDPAYAAAFGAARQAGVEAFAYQCRLSPEEVVLGRAAPIKTSAIRVTNRRSVPKKGKRTR